MNGQKVVVNDPNVYQSNSPLNQNTIPDGPGLPNPYGSAQDKRFTDVTQTHTLDCECDECLGVTEQDIRDSYLSIRPAAETPQWTPLKQIFSLSTPVTIDASIDIPFKAQSLRIDNLTNQWLFIAQLRRWIPPDWFGAVFSSVGISSVNIIWQAPPGLTNPAPTANTIVLIIAHSERLDEVAGTKRT